MSAGIAVSSARPIEDIGGNIKYNKQLCFGGIKQAVNSTATHRHDLTRYQGKNLLYLLASICLPAGLLYLRLVFGLAATDTRVTPAQSAWLNRVSTFVLVVFFLVQLFCARYVQHLLNPRRTQIGKAFQYLGVLVLCLFFSVTGTVMLEAFGFNFFLRLGGAR